MKNTLCSNLLTSLLACSVLAACDGAPPAAQAGIRQTGFPGQMTAGGGTSGDVMARTSAATAAAGNQEGMRGQAPGGSVAGTPSIPEGSGGTTSGAAMGGTTTGAAATQAAPASGGAAPPVSNPGDKK